MSKNSLILLSFIAVYFIWGSTYLMVAFLVEEIPPFFLSGLRYGVAGLIAFVIYKFSGPKEKVTKVEWKNASIAGILFLTIGNGGISWVLQHIDSGYAALSVAGQPLVLILLMWAYYRKPLPFQSFIGVFIGLLGMYLLVNQDQLIQTDTQWLAMAVVLMCLISWGIASIFVGIGQFPSSFMANTAIQMMVGGGSLMIFSLLWEDLSGFSFANVSIQSYVILAYLIIFGSLLAFTAFNYLLKNVSPEKVATSTYVNPIVAMILGYQFRNETITVQSCVAAVVLLLGVYFINASKSEMTKQEA